MNVRELLERLESHALDGRGLDEEVLVEFEGRRRYIEGAETRLVTNGDDRPKPTFVLLVADGIAA
jgi:hypothetical protein